MRLACFSLRHISLANVVVKFILLDIWGIPAYLLAAGSPNFSILYAIVSHITCMLLPFASASQISGPNKTEIMAITFYIYLRVKVTVKSFIFTVTYIFYGISQKKVEQISADKLIFYVSLHR